MDNRKRILTGDRPTGRLHLGHFAGSLQNRVRLQDEYDTLILVADVQALTTNFDRPERLAHDVVQITLDNLAVGLNPDKVTFFIQSMIPELAELTVFYGMFVTVNSLRHNPTIKTEIAQYGYKDVMYGFMGYPVSQAADITFCKAALVPVGEDQLPLIEQTRKIVRRFNELYAPVLVEPEALLNKVSRLVGLDGNNKMGKSLGNCIYLSDAPDLVRSKLFSAVTDPGRIKASDKGNPEICTIYSYHEAFNAAGAGNISEMCRAGSIGCVACKNKLNDCINTILGPIREERSIFENKPGYVREILQSGTERARGIAKETMREVRDAMSISYFTKAAD